MAGLFLTVRVVAAALRESGDRRDAAGENIVSVALLWPRPGKAEVLGSTGVVRLGDRPGKKAPPDTPPAFAAPVLKEKVQGDVALIVLVLDRDRQGKFARFLRSVAAAGIEAAGDAAAGSVPGLVRLAFTEAAEQGALHVAGERTAADRLEAVAVSRDPVVLTGEQLEGMAKKREPRTVQVRLDAPRDLMRPREKGRLAAGRPNGWISLELKVEEA
jgi:hypothetical protein